MGVKLLIQMLFNFWSAANLEDFAPVYNRKPNVEDGYLMSKFRAFQSNPMRLWGQLDTANRDRFVDTIIEFNKREGLL